MGKESLSKGRGRGGIVVVNEQKSSSIPAPAGENGKSKETNKNGGVSDRRVTVVDELKRLSRDIISSWQPLQQQKEEELSSRGKPPPPSASSQSRQSLALGGTTTRRSAPSAKTLHRMTLGVMDSKKVANEKDLKELVARMKLTNATLRSVVRNDAEILRDLTKKEKQFERKTLPFLDACVDEFHTVSSEYTNAFAVANDPSRIAANRERLNQEGEILRLKLEIAKLQEIQDGNLPEVTKELKEYHEITQEARREVEEEIRGEKEKLSKYEELGQRFLDLREAYMSQEESIKTHEWTLSNLRPPSGSSGIADDRSACFESSFVFFDESFSK